MAFMTSLIGGPTNATRRRTVVLTDQHGRKWNCNEDVRTSAAVGPYEPKGWSAPWYLPQGGEFPYYHRPEEEPFRLVLDYDACLSQLRQAHADWEHRIREVGIQLHGQAFDETKPTLAVLQRVGQKPTAIEPIIAMKQGNKYALGLTDTVDVRLAAFLPAKARGEDMDFSEPDLTDTLVPNADELPLTQPHSRQTNRR